MAVKVVINHFTRFEYSCGLSTSGMMVQFARSPRRCSRGTITGSRPRAGLGREDWDAEGRIPSPSSQAAPSSICGEEPRVAPVASSGAPFTVSVSSSLLNCDATSGVSPSCFSGSISMDISPDNKGPAQPEVETELFSDIGQVCIATILYPQGHEDTRGRWEGNSWLDFVCESCSDLNRRPTQVLFITLPKVTGRTTVKGLGLETRATRK